MTNNLIEMYDAKGNPGIAVYRARKRGTEDWKLLYIWADYNRDTYTDTSSGELMPKGYYMYLYLGDKIENYFSYDVNGPLAKIFLGEAKRYRKDDFEKHVSLIVYWGEDVLKELFEEIEVDLSKGVNIRFFSPRQGIMAPNRFIAEQFPVYVFKPFWKMEKWERLPEDGENFEIKS